MNEQIRVLIADDHPLFREGVAYSLSVEVDITVVEQADTGEVAFRLTRELMPDVVLLDIAMPGRGGIVAASEIATACPAVNIVMLTVSEHEDDLLAALKAGARGYVLKGVSARELANIIRRVSNGEVFVSSSLATSILQEFARDKPQDPLDRLTGREKEILRLVAKGLTNYEVGQQSHLAEKTVKHYMTNILRKLQVRSRIEATLLASDHGLSE